MGLKFDINNLTIGEAKEIASKFSQLRLSYHCQEKDNTLNNFAVGKIVIIRTYSAGVWCGTLEKKAGNEVILKNARRMWRWWCKESISLSAVVKYGIIQEKSKIAPPVNSVWLEAIEIMPIDGEPAKSILEAPIVQAE